MKMALGALALLLIVAVAASVPLQPYLDFQVLFHANMGLLRGIPLYDHAGQVEMIAQLAGVPARQVYVLPFPYPPWYALSTIWLAWLPVDAAARVWFGLNLLMLVASVGLLTRGMPPMRRALVFLGAMFWLPTLGSLFVGQYGFPVLLGAALMAHGLKRESPVAGCAGRRTTDLQAAPGIGNRAVGPIPVAQPQGSILPQHITGPAGCRQPYSSAWVSWPHLAGQRSMRAH